MPQSVNVCNLVEFVSLDCDSKYWAKRVLNYSDTSSRKDTSNIIKKAGYDVEENSKKMISKYISMLEDSSV